MGLFSSKKIITVSSTVYNLAGDINKRENFLKTTMAAGVLTNTGSITDLLKNAYGKGPGMKLRAYGRWCRSHDFANVVAQEAGQISLAVPPDPVNVHDQVPNTPGHQIVITGSTIGSADFLQWATQFMQINHPGIVKGAWTADFDPVAVTITLIYNGGRQETFTPAGYIQNHKYLYVKYDSISALPADPAKPNVPTKYKTESFTYIYSQNTGNSILDSMFTAAGSAGVFLPYVPIRVDNKFIGPGLMPEVYERCKAALKKAIDADYDDIVQKLQDNPSLKDIDYAYIVFGVSLNSKEPAALRYIYEFFQQMMLGEDLSGVGYEQWRIQWQAAAATQGNQDKWIAAQNDPTDPLYGQPLPEVIPIPDPPTFTVRINSHPNNVMNYDMLIAWSSVKEVTGSGQRGKVGDLWWEQGPTQIYEYDPALDGYSLSVCRLYWQRDNDSWVCLEIVGLTHVNNVYQNHTVDISGAQALSDPQESGFIIPLQEDIYKKLPLTVSTQMSTASSYLVVNAYQITKQPWYASGFFKVLLIVVVIIVTIYSLGTLGPASAGFLGSYLSIGSALGFTGTAALIAGAAVTQLAAVILAQIIMTGSKALLGDQIGGIIGSIAAMVVVAGATSFNTGQSLSEGFNGLLKSDNLIKLSMATADGFKDMQTAELADTQKQIQQLTAQTAGEQALINQMTEQNLGINPNAVNPLLLTGMYQPESPTAFINRTLMTGSDIAAITLDGISSFAELTLKTDLVV